MATSVLLACGLNEQQLPKLIFLREETDVDGSFLISCIMGQRLKIQNAGTILVCLHHTYQHYSNAGIRLGFNLNMAIEKGGLSIIDPLCDLADNLLTSSYFTPSQEHLLSHLWTVLEEKITQIQANKSLVTVIIDDVSALINLGATENMILRFCRRLQKLADGKDGLSVVIKLNTSHLYEHLCNNLEGMADAEIQINKLKSGNFKEVDGKLVSIRRNAANGCIQKSMLYKVNERNIKIFAPGEVGIKT